MRIAQVAPLHESVPPKTYGGTERVVHALTEELVRMGHEVTLFASGDSVTSARLVAPCQRSLRLDSECGDALAWHQVQLGLVGRSRQDFDVVHFHVDYLHFAASRGLDVPHLTTLHGRLDLPELVAVYDEFGDMPVVSISDSQRRPLPNAAWLGTVHHGLAIDFRRFNPAPEDFLAFVGRISPEKRVDRAIEIARSSGMKLKICAKVDRADQVYFETKIRSLLDDPLVQYVGELPEEGKLDLMARARGLLMPIDWPEPFGLVTIEAMACGTPVLAFSHGSMPEVIDHGVTGILVDDMPSAIAAVDALVELPRRAVRARYDQRFNARRMAEDYLRLYDRLVSSPSRPRHSGGSSQAA